MALCVTHEVAVRLRLVDRGAFDKQAGLIDKEDSDARSKLIISHRRLPYRPTVPHSRTSLAELAACIAALSVPETRGKQPSHWQCAPHVLPVSRSPCHTRDRNQKYGFHLRPGTSTTLQFRRSAIRPYLRVCSPWPRAVGRCARGMRSVR